MSNDNFPPWRVDDAIDRAVREMMHADPRPGLRRRVLARLELTPRGTWMRRPAGPWMVPAALAAAILLAVLFLPSSDQPLEVAQAPAPSALPAPSAPSMARAPSAPSERGAPPSQRVVLTAAFDPRSDRVTATNVRPPVTGYDEPAGATPDAFPTIGALATETVAPAPLVLPALEIQPLRLQALAPRR